MTRTLLSLLLALSLAACQRGAGDAFVAPRLSPAAPARAWPPAGWAWGLLKVESRPALRYGVSAPSVVSAGDVVILPGYGESAEWWFETARDLNDEGYTVWVLDGAGQGGSARFTASRDLGHVPDFDGDIGGLSALIQVAIRPRPSRPVVVLASGSAAVIALAAVERGLSIDRLIISAPALVSVPNDGAPRLAARFGFKTLRAQGASAWSRPDAPASTERQKIALGWAVANPDLRMGGPSVGWLLSQDKLIAAATTDEALQRVRAPVVVIASSGEGPIPCARMPRCMMHSLPARLPYHIEEDKRRGGWLAAVIGELDADHAS